METTYNDRTIEIDVDHGKYVENNGNYAVHGSSACIILGEFIATIEMCP